MTAADVVRAFLVALSEQRWDDAAALVVDDYVHRAPGHHMTMDGVRAFNESLRLGLPDVTTVIDDVRVDGDVVIARWTARGTHRGPLLGRQPTGNAVVINGCNEFVVRDGEIVEDTPCWDVRTLLDQL